MLSNKYFLFLIRLVIGGIFIYAAIDKIIDPAGFAKAIYNYRMMPPTLINLMAIIIPWVELISGICMIIGFKSKGANLIILGMLVVFVIALSSAFARGLNINCGCFSTASTVKSDLTTRIVEDGIMLIGCLLLLAIGRRKSNRGWR